jgi:hypothetical protein
VWPLEHDVGGETCEEWEALRLAACLVIVLAAAPRAAARTDAFCLDDRVWSVALVPGGDALVAAGNDGVVRAWDLRSGVELWRATAHTKSVEAVAASPDGKMVLSCSNDATVRLWGARSGAAIGRLDTPGFLGCHKARFSPDGKLIAASNLRTIFLWNAADLHPLPSVPHPEGMTTFAFSPDSKLIATGSQDGKIRIIDLASRKMQVRKAHASNVMTLAYSPDGTRIASGSVDQTLRLWDAATGRALGPPLIENQASPFAVAFAPDGGTLASVGADSLVRLYNTGPSAGASPKPATIATEAESLFDVAFSRDGAALAVARADKQATVFWLTGGAAAPAPSETEPPGGIVSEARLMALCSAAGAPSRPVAQTALGMVFPLAGVKPSETPGFAKAVTYPLSLPGAKTVTIVMMGQAPLSVELAIRNELFTAARREVEQIIGKPLAPVVDPIPLRGTFSARHGGLIITLIQHEGACTVSVVKCTQAPSP